MKLKSSAICIIIFFGMLALMSFNLPRNIQKKVTKEVKKTFEVDNFDLQPVIISKVVSEKLVHKITPDALFQINNNETLIGYAFVAKATSKTDEFDYLILLDTNLIVVKTKVLIYREDYGGEIGSRRWLKQFIGKTSKDKLTYEQNIIAISGATISASSMTIAINNFLQNLEVLHQNKVL